MLKQKFAMTAVSALALLTSGAALNAQANTDTDKNPYMKADGSWMTLSGTVTEATPTTFDLDYGEGTVLVEMDDYDAWPEAVVVAEGQEVTVTGRIDEDFLETTKIEASTVYIKELGTHFYASAADEEALPTVTFYDTPVIGDVWIDGRVTAINELENEFTPDTGFTELQVDTDAMSFDPLDDVGFMKIGIDDEVSVSGLYDPGIFEDFEIDANTIIKRAG